MENTFGDIRRNLSDDVALIVGRLDEVRGIEAGARIPGVRLLAVVDIRTCRSYFTLEVQRLRSLRYEVVLFDSDGRKVYRASMTRSTLTSVAWREALVTRITTALNREADAQDREIIAREQALADVRALARVSNRLSLAGGVQ